MYKNKKILAIVPARSGSKGVPLKNIKEIAVVNFDHNDVIRHPLVTKIVEAYQKNTNDKG